MDLITGGHFSKKGYYYRFYINLPKFTNSKCKNILNKEHKVVELKLDTGFSLTSNPNYVNFYVSLLGIALGLEIHVNEEGDLSEKSTS